MRQIFIIRGKRKEVERDTGLELSGYLNMDGVLVPVYLKPDTERVKKERLAKIDAKMVSRYEL